MDEVEIEQSKKNRYHTIATAYRKRTTLQLVRHCGKAAAQVLVLRQSRSCNDYCGRAAAVVIIAAEPQLKCASAVPKGWIVIELKRNS